MSIKRIFGDLIRWLWGQAPTKRSIYKSPYVIGYSMWLFMVIVVFVFETMQGYLGWIPNLIIALNGSAFAIYGLDKIFAVSRGARIPERVLWWSAFAGGPLGALIGMKFFHHKVSKGSFKFVLWVVIILEVALILLAWRYSGYQVVELSNLPVWLD